MSTQLHGTWRLVKHIDRDGKEDRTPLHAPLNYTFNPDGSASWNTPEGPKVPMRWKVVGGRLLIGTGALRGKGMRFEMPDPNTLVWIDPHERRGVFERVPEAEQKVSWFVKIARSGKRIDYEGSDQTCRFGAELQPGGRLLIHAYRWTDAQGGVHESTDEIRSVIVPRVVEYLHMGGWKGRVDVLSEPRT